MRAVGRSLVVVSMLAFASTAAAEPEVTVTLDASPKAARVGDVLRVEVRARVRGGSIDALELRDLRKYPELEIISHQTMRPMQFSFGFGSGVQVESSLAHVYMLRANAPGEYAFAPAIAKVDGEVYESEPLVVVVRAGAGMPQPDTPGSDPNAEVTELSNARFDERAFLRTVVEPEEVYVGQQVNVTVYLYTRLRLGPQSVAPTKPDMDGFWVYDDPITTLQAQTVNVMGTRYQVYALHRSVAFPQRAGKLTIGAPEVTFDVASMSFFEPSERVERVGVPVELDVKPLPSPVPSNAVVGSYELTASLDRSSVETGDAATLRIEVEGTGNIQDVRVDLPPIVGLRALQPSIRDRQDFVGGRLSGTRTFEWILIAETPGEHRVPSIRLDYFDPETGAYGSSTTAPLTLIARGDSKPSGSALGPRPARPRGPSHVFGPIGMYSALRRNEVPVRSRAWFGWALAVPPFAFALLVVVSGIRKRREREDTTPAAGRRKLLRDAQAALRDDDPRTFYDRVVAAIHHALDVRLGEPVTGLPHAELRTQLEAAGFDDDLVDRIINELEGADFARFAASGVDRGEMQRCFDRAHAIVERIERSGVSS